MSFDDPKPLLCSHFVEWWWKHCRKCYRLKWMNGGSHERVSPVSTHHVITSGSPMSCVRSHRRNDKATDLGTRSILLWFLAELIFSPDSESCDQGLYLGLGTKAKPFSCDTPDTHLQLLGSQVAQQLFLLCYKLYC